MTVFGRLQIPFFMTAGNLLSVPGVLMGNYEGSEETVFPRATY